MQCFHLSYHHSASPHRMILGLADITFFNSQALLSVYYTSCKLAIKSTECCSIVDNIQL